FPVVVGKIDENIREPVVAAARFSKGRVVAFGHTDYFEAAALTVTDTGRLVRNAVRWCARPTTAGPRVAVHGQPGLLAFLRKAGLAAAALDGDDWRGKLAQFEVLCLSPAS